MEDVWDIEEIFKKRGFRFDPEPLEDILALGKKIIETIEKGEKPSKEDFDKCWQYIRYLDCITDELQAEFSNNNVFPFAEYMLKDFWMFRDVNDAMYYMQRSDLSYTEPDMYNFFMERSDRTLFIKLLRDYNKKVKK